MHVAVSLELIYSSFKVNLLENSPDKLLSNRRVYEPYQHWVLAKAQHKQFTPLSDRRGGVGEWQESVLRGCEVS